jgi:hypothetical protein
MNFWTRPFVFVNVPRFLGVRAAGQQIMRQLRRRIRQNVAHDERFQFAQQIRANAASGHVFAEDNQRLDFATLNAFGDLRQVCSHRIGGQAGQFARRCCSDFCPR